MTSDASVVISEPQSMTAATQPDRGTRYILAQVGEQKLAFLPAWVNEVMQFEQARILSLPFYSAPILGVVHHQGEVVTLISAQTVVFAGQAQYLPETLTAVRLSQAVGDLAGIALVVDRVLGSVSSEQLSASSTRLLQLQDISSQLWQPHRWSNQG
jgi:chemotaxis signal transduction protein